MTAYPDIRVLHVYRTYFPDPPGGLQEAIRQISLATLRYGVGSTIFTLSPKPIPRELQFPEGKVLRSRSWLAPASCDLGGWDSVRQFRKEASSSDVIHYHFPWPFADILRLFGNKNTPSVMTYHSDLVRQRYIASAYRPLMLRTLKSMSAVVATSPTYAQTSPVLSKVEGDRLRIIPLGVADYRRNEVISDRKSDCLKRLSLGEEPFVLALGVLRYYKGLHTLLEAASTIKAKVVIAGSGPEDNNLKALAARLGTTNVVFAGQVSNEEKIALLQCCRALVLASHLRSEAFGMVLVEASMFGKPMVCCEVGSGTSFVNIHGETGFVVPPESPKLLAEAVNLLLSDTFLADRMGLSARNRYELLFSDKALGQAYASLYQEVLR